MKEINIKNLLIMCLKKKDKNYITFEEREEMFKKKEEEILNVNLAKRKEYFKHISKN